MYQVISYIDSSKEFSGFIEEKITENISEALEIAKNLILQYKTEGINFIKQVPYNETCYVDLASPDPRKQDLASPYPYRFKIIAKYCIFTILPNQEVNRKDIYLQLKNKEITFDILTEKYKTTQSKQIIAVIAI
jgi:hypothetical protein